MVDYIVVGLGLAGISFCNTLEENNKSFIVFDDGSQQSSTVAGGLYNPVILKRFTKVWKAEEQLNTAIPFYKKIEGRFDKQLDFKIPVYRRFTSVEEQNNWFERADNPLFQDFMSAFIHQNKQDKIDASLGYGEVYQTGRIDTKALKTLYFDYLKEEQKIKTEAFDYKELVIHDHKVQYKDITASYIVFAEGYGLKKNPFFNYLPLNGTKGQLLTIKAPKLKLDVVIKSSVFIIPLGNDIYRIGATYEWDDKTNTITQHARDELLDKLKSFLKCDFEIVSQEAGIRPTVTDRRPLVGVHPDFLNVFVLNGMGSRGVMIAPYIAPQLFRFIEAGGTIDKETDIKRFEKKYFKKQNT